jgi:hypothetical protein
MANRTGGLRLILALSPFMAVTGCSGGGGKPSSGGPEGAVASLELDATYPEPFSFLSSVRERADGSVMAADPLSQVVLQLDLSTGTADTLGRVGDGPQEYRQPDQVFPLPGDSTLLVDIGKVQLTVIDPAGSFHSGMKMASATENGGFQVIVPRFVDDTGRLYYTGSVRMGEGPEDSTLVARYDRATETVDTMGWVWRPAPRVTRSGDNVRVMSTQMAGRDDWAVGPGGEFAIVRAADYSVEWRLPDGRTVSGPPNPIQTPAITDEDKYAYLEERSAAGLMMMVSSSSSGAMDMTMQRGVQGSLADEPNLLDYEWAEDFPAFRPDRALISPEGTLWVERWLPAHRIPEMDVFNSEGVQLGSVDLPEGRQIIGFGSTPDGDPAVYLVRTDEFDLKWLERYRIVR